jgi:hypothetical protein
MAENLERQLLPQLAVNAIALLLLAAASAAAQPSNLSGQWKLSLANEPRCAQPGVWILGERRIGLYFTGWDPYSVGVIASFIFLSYDRNWF